MNFIATYEFLFTTYEFALLWRANESFFANAYTLFSCGQRFILKAERSRSKGLKVISTSVPRKIITDPDY